MEIRRHLYYGLQHNYLVHTDEHKKVGRSLIIIKKKKKPPSVHFKHMKDFSFSFVCKSLWIAFYFSTTITTVCSTCVKWVKRGFPPALLGQFTRSQRKINESLSTEVTSILCKLTYIRCCKKQHISNADQTRIKKED